MAGLRLTETAERDIVEILAWSHTTFGEGARRRYERLIATALADLAADPLRAGSLARPELGEGVRSWHLRSSRERARDEAGEVVQRPRHLLIYRPADAWTVIGRVLHDAMELEPHLRGEWE